MREDPGPSSTIASDSHLALEVTPGLGPNPAAVVDIAFRYGPA